MAPSRTKTIKLTRSRNGVALRIRDDGPGSATIEDANGNSVTLSPSGIVVNAGAKVSVSASTIEVNASQVTVNAGMTKIQRRRSV